MLWVCMNLEEYGGVAVCHLMGEIIILLYISYCLCSLRGGGGSSDYYVGWGREKFQSKAILKSVLKLRRSTEYMLSAEHSYNPASICVAGSISSFDFTLSVPIFHSWTCKPRYSLQQYAGVQKTIYWDGAGPGSLRWTCHLYNLEEIGIDIKVDLIVWGCDLVWIGSGKFHSWDFLATAVKHSVPQPKRILWRS